MTVDAVPLQRPDLLARAELVSAHLNIGAAAADVMGMTVTFTPDERPVIIETFVPFVLNKTAAGIASLLLTTSANVLLSRTQQQMAINDQRSWPGPRARLTNLVPGVPVTFKLRANSGAGAAIDVYADPTYKAFIQARAER